MDGDRLPQWLSQPTSCLHREPSLSQCSSHIKAGEFWRSVTLQPQLTSVISTLLNPSHPNWSFSHPKKSLVDQPSPKKPLAKRGMLLNEKITGANQRSPGELTGWPQGSPIKITGHCLESLSAGQPDTPQHISCHTQPIFQQQPINAKK